MFWIAFSRDDELSWVLNFFWKLWLGWVQIGKKSSTQLTPIFNSLQIWDDYFLILDFLVYFI